MYVWPIENLRGIPCREMCDPVSLLRIGVEPEISTMNDESQRVDLLPSGRHGIMLGSSRRRMVCRGTYPIGNVGCLE